jgi:hypothetical protein
MTMDELVGPLVAAILGGLIGGGAIAGLFYRALKDRLREDLTEAFATREEMNGLGGRVTGATSLATMAKSTADANSDRLTRLEAQGTEQASALSHTLSRIDKRLDDYEGWQRTMQSEVTRTVALLSAIEKRMDRHD